MRKWFVMICGLMTLSALLLSGIESEAQDAKYVIRVRGADSVAGRVEKITKIFMKENPEFNVVVSGGSKGIGLGNIIDKTGEVAMAPRKITDAERKEAASTGVQLTERLIGYGGIAVVVNSSNPMSDLSVEQLQKIFKGEFTNWSQVGGPESLIQVVSPSQSIHAGTMHFIEHDFLENSHLTSAAVIVGSFESVLRTVSENKSAIGFTRVREIEAHASNGTGFKALQIKQDAGSAPVTVSRQAIADGTYPIKRPFYLYYDEKAAPEVKKYVDFIVSKGWGSQRIE